MDCSDKELLQIGRQVLLDEGKELEKCAMSLEGDMRLVAAARLIHACKGRVVVCGLGKSGLVGRKIAATFASLGTPAFFLHAAEAIHGDLGMVAPEDVGLFLSNSGQTRELLELISYFKRISAPIIAITGDAASALATAADVVLSCRVEREAGPLGLAPTSSTTLQMALGDALAGMATRLMGLCKEDFALFHPGGTLGRRLLLRVSDLMGSGSRLPVVPQEASVRDALFEITSKGYGATTVVDASGGLVGIFTDGDLRRLFEKMGTGAMEMPIAEAMMRSPRTIVQDRLAIEALRVMEQLEISVLVALEDAKSTRPVGMVHLHDILRAGVA